MDLLLKTVNENREQFCSQYNGFYRPFYERKTYMSLQVSKVDVWQRHVDNQPGTLAKGLSVLTAAGANLEFTLARQDDKEPKKSSVFTAPLVGAKQTRAAAEIQFHKNSLQAIRVEGADRPGFAADVAAAVGSAGVNIRDFFGTVSGKNVVIYIFLDSGENAAKAIDAVKKIK
jgi:hypothetical protein